VALTASTVDWTSYTYEVTVPVGMYFAEVGVGVTALSAGDIYVEIPQVFTEYSNPYQRGMQGINLLTQQLILAGEDTASVDLAQFYWSAANELRLLASGGNFHIGLDAAEVDTEIHGDLVCDGLEATTLSYDATRTRIELIDFTTQQTGRWTTGNGMTLDQDAPVFLTAWPTLLGDVSGGATHAAFPIPMKKGETLTQVVIGVDDTVDAGSPTWGLGIVSYDLMTGAATTEASTTGVTRTGATAIRQVTWAPAFNRSAADNVLILIIEIEAGAVSHHHYYIKLTITTPGVDASLGLE
jgi:hypothetical protein